MGVIRRMNRGWGSATLAISVAIVLTGCTTAAGLQAAPGGAGRISTASPASPAVAEHELYNLATDLFFVHLPPGSTRTAQKCTPALDDPRGGGRCTVDFTSALTPQTVSDYFTRSAALNGWTAEQKGGDGSTLSWSTTYRSGSRAHAVLTPLDPQRASPPYAYELAASV
ncbi:hypothetical protein [Sinomonas atrocyanea]|uniref:hypothetical protein n=1 Tax=Sinomonas atrocyanea TaxID=37927 RepID=UPI00277F79BB|nr:hypothetical protein [Sinomonas atrocyanea]MDQ0259585.1 hypothetical protein [Sinomonas atrocyanea]MDR6623157.1 hypothetical protein [Sinomonas atrocyanea]